VAVDRWPGVRSSHHLIASRGGAAAHEEVRAMALVTDMDVPFVDIFDPAAQASMNDWIAGVRDDHWLVRTPLWYSVIDYEGVKALQSDRRLHSMAVRAIELQGVTEGDLYDRVTKSLLALEGDDHTRLRRLVSRAFTPRAVDRVRPRMREFLERRLEAVAPNGACEFMADVANAYPIAVICELVGAPREDWPLYSAWADSAFRIFNFDAANAMPAVEAAFREMGEHVEALVERKRAAPADDLLSGLLAVEEEGDRLTREELVEMVGTILLAGTDTTRNQLGLGMMLFAAHPEQWARLGDDPSIVPHAVTEVLRFDPTAAATPRVVVEDFEFRGVTFPAGTLVSLVSSSANRDPAVVACPDQFDIELDRGSFHPLTFGGGHHYCLGANLARAELEEAFLLLPRWLPDLALDGEPEMKPYLGLYGPRSLPIRYTPTTAPA
jgi:cytochrome P450